MDVAGLQQRLTETGHFNGDFPSAIRAFLTDGPDVRLSDNDFNLAAQRLEAPLGHVRAVYEVESSGNPFIDGRPTILFEPHIFSRLTGHVYDSTHPGLSSRQWNRALYPASQEGRYDQLIHAVLLNPDAGFGSASYGAFQILGCNYARCDVKDAMAFAWQEAQSEGDQLNHFANFVTSDPITWRAFRNGDWVTFAKRYNGTAYYKNRYDVRLAKAARKWL